MNCYELKLYIDTKIKKQTNNQILKLIESKLLTPLDGKSLKINPASKIETLKTYLKEKYEDCTIRDSITDGCYGARTGKSSTGLTVWMHPRHLVDRYVDSDGTEFVNPYSLLTEHGELVSETLDGESFEEMVETLGLDVKSDNTYNFNSNSTEDASFMFDFQFSTIETKNGSLIASIMFHCGGDPRGNYTEKRVWKFKYVDDFYSVIFPYKILTEDAEA